MPRVDVEGGRDGAAGKVELADGTALKSKGRQFIKMVIVFA